MSQPISKFAIADNQQIPEAEKLTGRIKAFMEKKGAAIQVVSAINDKKLRQRINIKKKEFEALIVLGATAPCCAPATYAHPQACRSSASTSVHSDS